MATRSVRAGRYRPAQPEGWTGQEVDGLPAEGRSLHQVPLAASARTRSTAQLEAWLRSYRPRELFDEGGALREELAALAPAGERRMSANRTQTAVCRCASSSFPTSATTE